MFERSAGKQRRRGGRRHVLQVVRLDAGGIRVDFESSLKLLHVVLLHRHLSLDKKDVLGQTRLAVTLWSNVKEYTVYTRLTDLYVPANVSSLRGSRCGL